MAELIDRKEIFFERKQTGNKEYDEGFLDGAMCVLNAIDEMPTIEAKPVVHAHWIELFDGENPTYPCSNCMNEQWRTFDFCPCCGAQMDEHIADDRKKENEP